MSDYDKRLLKKFMAIFDVPDIARPYLHRMVDQEEMRLAAAIKENQVTCREAAKILGLSPEETEACLERAFRRSILDREENEGTARYCLSNFYRRLDAFAVLENWGTVPAPVRRQLSEWSLKKFAALKRESVELLKRGVETVESLGNDIIILREEVDEVIDKARDIALITCNCRATNQACDRPKEVCLLMDSAARSALNRKIGKRIGKEEAKQIVRLADRKGLMHTVNGDWRTNGPEEICNCCADDCYPFRAAALLQSKGVWPQSRYVAAFKAELCNLCGLCVKRCHFEAFYQEEETREVSGRKRKEVGFDPAKCWGCGLCANTCPTEAITMRPLG